MTDRPIWDDRPILDAWMSGYQAGSPEMEISSLNSVSVCR